MWSASMPLRILTVTGTSYGAAARTAVPTMERNSPVFHGSAAPPPLRVTLGTGQPKLRSTWSARSSVDEHPDRGADGDRVDAVQLEQRGFSCGPCWISAHRLRRCAPPGRGR